METFLGVSGFDALGKAVTKCWASQFGFVAVQYKRRYGQPIDSDMSVVIQEMVPSDVSGVMFTVDPVSANPLSMSITANFGLGEVDFEQPRYKSLSFSSNMFSAENSNKLPNPDRSKLFSRLERRVRVG